MLPAVDTVETIQVVSALLGTLFTVRALQACYWDLQATKTRPDLRVIANRRLRQQAFILLTQATLLIVGTVSLFLDIGTTQSTLRSFAMGIVSLIVLVLSVTDHLEDIPWLDRRKPDSSLPHRRSTDPDEPRDEPRDEPDPAA